MGLDDGVPEERVFAGEGFAAGQEEEASEVGKGRMGGGGEREDDLGGEGGAPDKASGNEP